MKAKNRIIPYEQVVISQTNMNYLRAWVVDLRSGKYTQGKYRLRTIRDEYCCFGVLMNIVCPGEWEKRGDLYTIRGLSSTVPVGMLGNVLQARVRIPPPRNARVLSSVIIRMNDAEQRDFLYIADAIEGFLERILVRKDEL